MSYCPSQDWDHYSENAFEGCPVCQAEEDTWIDVDKLDPKRDNLNDPLKCKNCGVYFDFA